jgi:hypothetical protein
MRVCAGLRAGLLVLSSAVLAAGCGKKGPPLAPLRIVPDAPAAVTAARLGPEINLRFTIPSKNAAGAPGDADIDRMEIYGVSLAAGAPAPPNREFLGSKFLVGTVRVRPADVAGAPQPDPAVADPRPGAGEVASFSETLSAELLDPPRPTTPPPPAVVFTRGQVPSVPVNPNWWAPSVPTRVYAVRAISRRGVAGNPSARLTVPLVPPPPPPASLDASHTADAIVLTWTAAPREPGAALRFNVYKASAPAGPPLTPAPIAPLTFTRPGVAYGVEECFTVRSVEQLAASPGVTVESEPAAAACITPRDTFAPAAPGGLDAVSSGGVISLIWDANTEADLAGYLVLRGEAPGDTLQAITATPISETVFRDTSVKAGVRYVYAIVAVDNANPRNASPLSARKEVTAVQ